MTTARTREDKIADTQYAFRLLREELTPPPMRELITKLTDFPSPAQDGDSQALMAYASLVQGGMVFAQIVAANDRIALQSAAHLMGSGVGRKPEDA